MMSMLWHNSIARAGKRRSAGAIAPATVRAVLFLVALCAIGIVDALFGMPAHAWYWHVLWIAYVIVAGATLWAHDGVRH